MHYRQGPIREERNSGLMMAFIDINAMQNVAFSFEFVS